MHAIRFPPNDVQSSEVCDRQARYMSIIVSPRGCCPRGLLFATTEKPSPDQTDNRNRDWHSQMDTHGNTSPGSAHLV